MSAEEAKEKEARLLAELVQEEQLCEEAPRVFTWLLTAASILLVILTAPLSLLLVLKVVQEYEKVVVHQKVPTEGSLVESGYYRFHIEDTIKTLF